MNIPLQRVSARLLAGMFLILTGCGGGSAEPEHTAPEPLTSATAAASPAQGHLDRLNEIRAAAGLQRLERNGALALAAQRHADYQTLNGVSGHGESAGNPGFSGTGYGDRAAAAGYAGRLVAEVPIGGTPRTHEECRQFMDVMLIAPGHRSVLLGHEFNEAGVGGNPLTTLLGTRGTPWVAHDRLTLYPLNGQAGVPTRFAPASESPNPLPGVAMTGMPLTVHGGMFASFTVQQAELVDTRTGAAVELLPNDALGQPRSAFAFFPKDSLVPHVTYRFATTVVVLAQPRELVAQFTTGAF